MGLIEKILGAIFGGGRNVIVDTAEVFRENAEAGAERETLLTQQVLAQFGSEFGLKRRGLFDTVMDAINRIPRPAMALGTLGLFISAMVDPIWFSQRMQGIALVPEPLWWLLGAIVSFYFGARHQFKGQEFQRSLASTMAMTPQVVSGIRNLRALENDTPGAAATGTDAVLTNATTQPDTNRALNDWRQGERRDR
ncbi:holin family protein [Roseovarius sp. 2305UL8-3]|uniref:holin family protein n=1 Tax=Roseovarius conchicola TaxID=3121636 RepID=UPI003528A0C7